MYETVPDHVDEADERAMLPSDNPAKAVPVKECLPIPLFIGEQSGLESLGVKCVQFGAGNGLPPGIGNLHQLSTHVPSTSVSQAERPVTTGYPHFQVVDPLMLEGHLASALHQGGAYTHASAVDAAGAARDFCRRFFADRYDDVVVLSGPGWTEWWHQVTGDYAWIMTDLGAKKVHLLCASGAD